jgi:hypothetical protein
MVLWFGDDRNSTDLPPIGDDIKNPGRSCPWGKRLDLARADRAHPNYWTGEHGHLLGFKYWLPGSQRQFQRPCPTRSLSLLLLYSFPWASMQKMLPLTIPTILNTIQRHKAESVVVGVCCLVAMVMLSKVFSLTENGHIRNSC